MEIIIAIGLGGWFMLAIGASYYAVCKSYSNDGKGEQK